MVHTVIHTQWLDGDKWRRGVNRIVNRDGREDNIKQTQLSSVASSPLSSSYLRLTLENSCNSSASIGLIMKSRGFIPGISVDLIISSHQLQQLHMKYTVAECN